MRGLVGKVYTQTGQKHQKKIGWALTHSLYPHKIQNNIDELWDSKLEQSLAKVFQTSPSFGECKSHVSYMCIEKTIMDNFDFVRYYNY